VAVWAAARSWQPGPARCPGRAAPARSLSPARLRVWDRCRYPDRSRRATTGGSRANLRYLEHSLRFTGARDELLTLIAADAQTSGGLLLCVPAGRADALARALADEGVPARVIGELAAATDECPVGTMTLRAG